VVLSSREVSTMATVAGSSTPASPVGLAWLTMDSVLLVGNGLYTMYGTCPGAPSGEPTSGKPSGQPTGQRTGIPTGQPTGELSGIPGGVPTGEPTGEPSGEPTTAPTGQPTGISTGQPSGTPSGAPSGEPPVRQVVCFLDSPPESLVESLLGRNLVMPCCRALAVELNGAFLSLKGARQDILTVSTSSLPSQWIQLAVTIRDVTSNSTNYAYSIFPSTFNISRDLAGHYPRTVSFFPPVAGTFTIEVVVTRPSRHEFVVKYPTGEVLQVLGV
jgi:hypothetical protein